MSGSVTNVSEETWIDVNVLPIVGETPMTTRDELDTAVRTPEETAVGNRVDRPGSFVAVGDLEPGQSVDFTVRVPRAELPPAEAPGVYWTGVHALGTNADGRDTVADGRARTFVPVLDRETLDETSVPLTLVVPLREQTARGADGSLSDAVGWVELVSETGRLGRLSRFAAEAGSRPLTWLLDPAVLDALDDLGQGNPSLSLGPPERVTDGAGGDTGDEPAPDGDDPGPEPSPSTSAEPELDEGGVPDATQAAASRTLLQRLLDELSDADVLSLPYADTDAAALLRLRPGQLARAYDLAAARVRARDLTATPVASPPDGQIDVGELGGLPDDVELLLSDGGDLTRPVRSTLGGRTLTLADARVGSGGPAPTEATDPLALRQRILAEAAVEGTQAALAQLPARPIVVVLPPDWDPGEHATEADFFDQLDRSWLQLADLPTLSEPFGGELDYSRAARERELGQPNVSAAGAVVRRGLVLDELLANRNDVLSDVTALALGAVSYHARAQPREAVETAESQAAGLDADLAQVGIFGTDFVTLSSGSGTLTATVVNELEQPVTVGIGVRSDADVRIEDVEPVELGPEERVTLRLPVTSDDGVHDVALVPLTTSGSEAGAPYEFVLRTTQVGRTVWYVMAGAALLFLVALLRRLRQTVGRERRTPGADA